MRWIFILLLCPLLGMGQTGPYNHADSSAMDAANTFKWKKLIIPSVFVGYGAASLFSEELIELNTSTRYETREHIKPGATIDNYMQYAPAAAVYGLNAFGINGKHDLRDRTIIYGSSQLILAAFIIPMKKLGLEVRPDGSNRASFPSGHTATAFSAAQFMFHEYKDSNPWIAFAGYPVAAATGTYRIFNDRHWVGDVVAGAGIGMLSTEMAYWLFPYTSKLFLRQNHRGYHGHYGYHASLLVTPTYQQHGIGIAMLSEF